MNHIEEHSDTYSKENSNSNGTNAIIEEHNSNSNSNSDSQESRSLYEEDDSCADSILELSENFSISEK